MAADIGLPAVAIEAEGERVGAVLIECDVDAFADLSTIEVVRVHGALIEAVGEEAGFDGRHSPHGVVGQSGDAFDGVALLGIDGLIGGDGAGDEGGDLGSILDADEQMVSSVPE